MRQFDDHADATFAIDASTRTPAAAELQLGGLVHEHGLDSADGAHLLAVLGPIDAAVRERLPERRRRAADGDAAAGAGRARYDVAGEMAALRAFAARRSAA